MDMIKIILTSANRGKSHTDYYRSKGIVGGYNKRVGIYNVYVILKIRMKSDSPVLDI